MMNEIITKKCTKCGLDLPPSCFYKDKRVKSGLKSWCKSCDKKIPRSPEALARARSGPSIVKKNEYMRQRLAYMRANNEEYQEDKRRRDRAYRQTDAGKLTKLRAKSKRRSIMGEHTITAAEWNKTLVLFGHRCAYCGKESVLTFDHFIPISKGGDTTPSNIVPACVSCNSSKQDKLPEDWCTADTYFSIVNLLTGR